MRRWGVGKFGEEGKGKFGLVMERKWGKKIGKQDHHLWGGGGGGVNDQKPQLKISTPPKSLQVTG